MMTTAWPVNTNANLFFDKKKNRKLANIRPSLHFYGMIILVEKGPLQKSGMAAIPKNLFSFFNFQTYFENIFFRYYFVEKTNLSFSILTHKRCKNSEHHFETLLYFYSLFILLFFPFNMTMTCWNKPGTSFTRWNSKVLSKFLL